MRGSSTEDLRCETFQEANCNGYRPDYGWSLCYATWKGVDRTIEISQAVLSDAQAVYSLSHKKTIKDGSTLRLRATLLFLQEVNSTFEAGGEALKGPTLVIAGSEDAGATQ